MDISHYGLDKWGQLLLLHVTPIQQRTNNGHWQIPGMTKTTDPSDLTSVPAPQLTMSTPRPPCWTHVVYVVRLRGWGWTAIGHLGVLQGLVLLLLLGLVEGAGSPHCAQVPLWGALATILIITIPLSVHPAHIQQSGCQWHTHPCIQHTRGSCYYICMHFTYYKCSFILHSSFARLERKKTDQEKYSLNICK